MHVEWIKSLEWSTQSWNALSIIMVMPDYRCGLPSSGGTHNEYARLAWLMPVETLLKQVASIFTLAEYCGESWLADWKNTRSCRNASGLWRYVLASLPLLSIRRAGLIQWWSDGGLRMGDYHTLASSSTSDVFHEGDCLKWGLWCTFLCRIWRWWGNLFPNSPSDYVFNQRSLGFLDQYRQSNIIVCRQTLGAWWFTILL